MYRAIQPVLYEINENDNHYQLKYHILFHPVNPYMEKCTQFDVMTIPQTAKKLTACFGHELAFDEELHDYVCKNLK